MEARETLSFAPLGSDEFADQMTEVLMLREPWQSVFARVHDGDHPHMQDLARAIRLAPAVPRVLAEYVAGRMDGSIVPPHARPRIPRRQRLRELLRLATEYAWAYAEMRRQGVRPAHAAALTEVMRMNEAAGRHMSLSRLVAKLKEANREPEIQELIPTREEAWVLDDLAVDQLMAYKRMVAEDDDTLSKNNLFGYWAWRETSEPGTLRFGQATLFQEAIDRRLKLLDAFRGAAAGLGESPSDGGESMTDGETVEVHDSCSTGGTS